MSPVSTSRPFRAAGRSTRVRRRRTRFIALASAVVTASTLMVVPSASAQQTVGLGTAETFAVLAGSGITNTGPTTITGDVGTFPTPSETGFGSVTLTGASTNHGGDALTQTAKIDLVTAYDDAAARTPVTNLATELGGLVLPSGVYTSPTFGLTGTLTLDALGDPSATFVFQAGSTLITAADSQVLLVNGANPCRVVWQVGSSATFGTRTSFVGDVLSQTSITANNSATFQGRLLARDGAVTLDANTISNGACATANTGALGGDAGTPAGDAASDLGLTAQSQPTPTGTRGSGPVPPRLAMTGSPLAGRAALAALLISLGAAVLVIERRSDRVRGRAH